MSKPRSASTESIRRCGCGSIPDISCASGLAEVCIRYDKNPFTELQSDRAREKFNYPWRKTKCFFGGETKANGEPVTDEKRPFHVLFAFPEGS
jgi:hypothetical protein